MNAPPTANRKQAILEGATVLARWLLGALFIYMGLNKALHTVEFLKLVREYHMVDNYILLNLIATLLPWFEVFCGILLVAGVAVRGTALVLITMLVPFTLLVLIRALAIHAAKDIAFCSIKFDCGCGAGEVYICAKLVENTFLTLLSFWLLSGHGRPCSVRYELRPSAPAEDKQPVEAAVR